MEFLSYRVHAQYLTRYDKGKASHKFKVFIFQYSLCLSLFDCFLHFKIKAKGHGGWLLWHFLRENAPTVKISGMQFPCFKFAEPCFYRTTFFGFCICFQHLHQFLQHFYSLSDSCFSVLFKIFCIWEEEPEKNRYAFMPDWIKFLYTLYKHNIGNQLYSSIRAKWNCTERKRTKKEAWKNAAALWPFSITMLKAELMGT